MRITTTEQGALVIPKATNRKKNSTLIRIQNDVFDWIDEVSKETSRPMSEIASEMIRFAIPAVILADKNGVPYEEEEGESYEREI